MVNVILEVGGLRVWKEESIIYFEIVDGNKVLRVPIHINDLCELLEALGVTKECKED
jgi:hypothetical protein